MNSVVINLKQKKLSNKNKGIRTGKEYLAGLRDERNVWMHGKKVKDVTKEPGILRGCHTLASFFDNQNNLWVGSINGLNFFDRSTGTFKRFFSRKKTVFLS